MTLDRLADLPWDNIIQFNINEVNVLMVTFLELNIHCEVYNSAFSLMKYGCYIQIFQMLTFVPNSINVDLHIVGYLISSEYSTQFCKEMLL